MAPEAFWDWAFNLVKELRGGKFFEKQLEDLATKEPDLNAQTGTAYSLALTDRSGIVTMDNANSNTVTIPANASVAFPLRTVINIVQIGAGATSVAGDTGVTLNSVSAGSGAIGSRWNGVSLLKIGTDTWVGSGDIGVVS